MILEQYPKIFRPLYERICSLCQNTAEVMNMFSKELEILDKNTVFMMIEKQRDTIEKLQRELNEKQNALNEKQNALGEKQGTIDQQQAIIEELRRSLEALKKA